jgi:hypothetical protein
MDLQFIQEINGFPIEKGKHSQYQEEKVLNAIFEKMGTTSKFLVDFGAGDGHSLSNSRYFLEKGWDGLLMEGKKNNVPDIMHEFITAENIEKLFEKYNVPEKFDLLSIDIDGNDYWVWKAIKNYRPRVVIIEFNGTIKEGISKTIEYNPEHCFGNNDYYGASFEALRKLGLSKAYTLVCQVATTNMVFIDSIEIGFHDFEIEYMASQYHPHTDIGEWVFV